MGEIENRGARALRVSGKRIMKVIGYLRAGEDEDGSEFG